MRKIINAMYGIETMTGEELFLVNKSLDEKAKQISEIYADQLETFLTANNLDVMNKAFGKVETLDNILNRLYKFKAKVLSKKRTLDARTKLTS